MQADVSTKIFIYNLHNTLEAIPNSNHSLIYRNGQLAIFNPFRIFKSDLFLHGQFRTNSSSSEEGKETGEIYANTFSNTGGEGREKNKNQWWNTKLHPLGYTFIPSFAPTQDLFPYLK